MGILCYGDDGAVVAVDDEVLANLRFAVLAKLRRSESFLISWQHPAGAEGGRTVLWVHQSVPIRFVFASTEAPAPDRASVEELMRAANSSAGIVLPAEQIRALETALDGELGDALGADEPMPVAESA